MVIFVKKSESQFFDFDRKGALMAIGGVRSDNWRVMAKEEGHTEAPQSRIIIKMSCTMPSYKHNTKVNIIFEKCKKNLR